MMAGWTTRSATRGAPLKWRGTPDWPNAPRYFRLPGEFGVQVPTNRLVTGTGAELDCAMQRRVEISNSGIAVANLVVSSPAVSM
jgi:hypothetical protein